MTGGKELRKALEAAVKAGLEERSYRRLRSKELFHSDSVVTSPLEARMLVSVEADKFGDVRISGAAQILCPDVERLLEGRVPRGALTRFQEVYYGRRPFPVASTSFDALDGPRMDPLEWWARTSEEGLAALEEFFEFVDGPVQAWVREHSTPEVVRAAADEGGPKSDDGAIIRSVSALDAVMGDLPAAVERLRRYREAPESGVDSVERVDAFIDWLRTAADPK